MPLTGYEETSVVEVGAVLDTSPATPEEVYLRTMAYSERAIAAVAAKRAGSGGALPSQWTVDAGGGATIAPDDGTGASLEVDAPPSIGGSMLYVGREGGVLLQAQTAEETEGKLSLETNGSVTLANGGSAAAPNEILFGADGWITFSNNAWVAISPGGYLNIEAHGSEPPDGDVRLGNMVVWFDNTEGALKLRVKAQFGVGFVHGSLDLT